MTEGLSSRTDELIKKKQITKSNLRTGRIHMFRTLRSLHILQHVHHKMTKKSMCVGYRCFKLPSDGYSNAKKREKKNWSISLPASASPSLPCHLTRGKPARSSAQLGKPDICQHETHNVTRGISAKRTRRTKIKPNCSRSPTPYKLVYCADRYKGFCQNTFLNIAR